MRGLLGFQLCDEVNLGFNSGKTPSTMRNKGGLGTGRYIYPYPRLS